MCIYIHIHLHLFLSLSLSLTHSLYIYAYIHIYRDIYVYVYVCMYVCICKHLFIHIHLSIHVACCYSQHMLQNNKSRLYTELIIAYFYILHRIYTYRYVCMYIHIHIYYLQHMLRNKTLVFIKNLQLCKFLQNQLNFTCTHSTETLSTRNQMTRKGDYNPQNPWKKHPMTRRRLERRRKNKTTHSGTEKDCKEIHNLSNSRIPQIWAKSKKLRKRANLTEKSRCSSKEEP